jgi:hypothetical protein
LWGKIALVLHYRKVIGVGDGVAVACLLFFNMILEKAIEDFGVEKMDTV